MQRKLQHFAKSTNLRFDSQTGRAYLAGANLGHQLADCDLVDRGLIDEFGCLKWLQQSYHQRGETYDLCFEDSWTGWFVASELQERKADEQLNIIHLDDHTDMMSTLLLIQPEGLVEPTTGQLFDIANPTHWETAINTGALGIGNYFTALYYGPRDIHIAHLKSGVAPSHSAIGRGISRSPLLPESEFADLLHLNTNARDSLGTYCVDGAPDRLLQRLEGQHAMVHIDLDYFINDYNGNVGTAPVPVDECRYVAAVRMEEFFAAIDRFNIKIDRWMIATSPGFCSMLHWSWLIDSLVERIEKRQ